jgi:exopolysaccharide biosynthesis polyprenyl glycosylphosphotransferase
MKIIYRTKQLMLMTGDLLGFCFGFWLSLFLRYGQAPNWIDIERHLNLFVLLFLLWLTINYIGGLYDLPSLKHTKNKRRFIESGILSIIISVILIYILPQKNISPKTILLLNILSGYSLSYLWRIIYNKYINSKKLISNIIFVGLTKETEELIKILQRYPERGYRTVALIDPNNSIKSNDFPFFDVYHGLKTLRPAISTNKASIVVIAPHLKEEYETMNEIYELLFWGIKITDIPSFYEEITGKIPPSAFSEGWFLEHLQNEQLIYRKIRTSFDYLVGVLLGIVFVSIFPILFILIKINSKGPVFFKQKRVGKNGKEFNLYKLRSMYALTASGSAEIDGVEFAQKNDKRITFIGKFLRRSRVDELPQFINLLKGNITLIGPRPERPEIIEKLQDQMPFYSLRHTVKPGLTGWAAVNQHYTDTLETTIQKLQYDLYYIKNRCFLLDVSILLRTINVVLRGMGQ